MNNEIKGMFSEEKYIELMNKEIKQDEEYEEGTLIIHTGGGIALTKDGNDVTSLHSIMLSNSHNQIEKEANKALKILKLKYIKPL